MRPASMVACLWALLKLAGTVMTAPLTWVARWLWAHWRM